MGCFVECCLVQRYGMMSRRTCKHSSPYGNSIRLEEQRMGIANGLLGQPLLATIHTTE